MNEDIIELDKPVKDLKEIKPSVNLMKALAPAIKRPTFTYRLPTQSNTRKSGEAWYPAEYDFVDIGMAEDTDSFVYQANFKKLALAIKAGWVFVSRDQESLTYIKRRIAELEIAQGQSFWALLVEILSNLLRYHNCFLIKARDINTSSGKVRDVDGFKLKPVAGYFVASPETMLFQIGKDYNIKGYKHIMPDGREKVFAPEDVVHFHIYRKTHHLAGTPSWVPVLDDVTALRRIEENIENLVHQHIHPLFQYKVGTENAPMKRFEDGLTECDIVRAKIQDMPNDGMIVTPERHEIKGLGSESRALRAETYLEYFKKRVISGSGLSEIDFGYGDTSNRATADTMSKLAIDNVKFYQQCMSDVINFYMVRELMLESTFQYDHSDDEQRVELQFNEIDVESQMKLQNHYMLLYQGHVATESETRKHIGKEPLSDDHREDTFLTRVEKQKADWQAQADIDKANAVAKNRQQPTNQHGKKSGPGKRKSSVETDGVAAETYNQLAADIKKLQGKTVNLGYVNQLFLATAERAKLLFQPSIDNSIIRGAKSYPLSMSLRVELDMISKRVRREYESDIDRLFKDAAVKTQTQLAFQDDERLAIDTLEYRIRFIERTLLHKAYIFGKVAAMRKNGVQRAVIQADPEGEDYDIWHNVVIDLNDLALENLPPYHPNCQCDIEPELPNV
jgi:hypothetical protein